MSVALIAPGRTMLFAPGRPVLWRDLRGTGGGGGGGGGFSGPYPSAITGLSGWWDAGLIGSILDPSGVAIPAFGSNVGSLADKSGTGAGLAVYHQASGSAAPVATPRVNGLLGGLGRNTVVPPTRPASGQQLPAMDSDQGLALGAAQMGSGQAWTRYLVWTRPNWRQNSSAASPLITVGTTVVLAVDNAGGSNRLVLFPGTSPAVLFSFMTRRHTHAVILRNTPGWGVDVWLDGALLASGVTNPLASSYSARLLFLHDGTAGGGAQCWFHEAATWEHALSTDDITTLIGCGARWMLGTRKGVQILVTGQSNAGNGLNDGAWHLLAQGIAWHLGAAAYNVVGAYSNPGTCIGGHGIYDVPAQNLYGSFIADPGDGSSPAGWSLGADGIQVQSYLTATPSADDADICAILWPWSETDFTRAYSEKAYFAAGAGRFLALARNMLGRGAASLPLIWWNAIPFPWSNNPGMEMHREVVAELAADSTQNVVIALPQTADSIPRGAQWVPSSGLWSDGDVLHRDATDNMRFGRVASALAARAILASSGGDTLSSIPSGIPAAGGPQVTHAYRQDDTTIIVTVQHDCGTDLIVPPTLAASGVGWAVMDGGSNASPGTVVNATACVRVDATHLRITLATALVNASASCRLFYPYGYFDIGRGDAVTDNYASVAKPAGWDIGANLGSAWSQSGTVQSGPAGNWPIQAPMTVTGGVAASGIVLSDTA